MSLSYFRLTHKAFKDLQKRSHHSSTYRKAKRDSIFASFPSHLRAETDEIARLASAYSEGTGAKQKHNEHGFALIPGAVSLPGAEKSNKQIGEKEKKRKRLRATELEQLAIYKRNVKYGAATGRESGVLMETDKSGGEYLDEEETDEDIQPHYGYKGEGRPRRFKNKISSMPADTSDQTSRPKRNLKRPDYTMAKIYGTVQSIPVSSESENSSSPSPRDIYESLEPQFTEFPCQWKECKAVLVTLNTLKKHLSVVHSKEAREQLRCQWDECGRLGTPVFFCKLSDVDGHVLEHHIERIAWKFGDGIGRVVGGPIAPGHSVNPPLLLFRDECHEKALREKERLQS